jgi:transposase
MTCEPGSLSTPRPPWSPRSPYCARGLGTRRATPPGSPCGNWDGALSSPGGQIERLDDLIVPLVTARAPGLLVLHGVGPQTAALLLVAAGDHPERLRSEAAWAHLCAVAPIPASSGKRTRHRLNRGGDRQANHALWRIVITRMSSHPATRAYVERRTKEGLSKKEIIRCLKRYVAREVYPCLRTPAG